jgi:hypothetical protein
MVQIYKFYTKYNYKNEQNQLKAKTSCSFRHTLPLRHLGLVQVFCLERRAPSNSSKTTTLKRSVVFCRCSTSSFKSMTRRMEEPETSQPMRCTRSWTRLRSSPIESYEISLFGKPLGFFCRLNITTIQKVFFADKVNKK